MEHPHKCPFQPVSKTPVRKFYKFAFYNQVYQKFLPYKSVQKAKVPIIFFHGGKDDYVPFSMSEKLYKVCSSQKKLVIIPDAYHGVAYPENPSMYISAIKEFQKEVNE